jgi:multidrug resistance efflux pump
LPKHHHESHEQHKNSNANFHSIIFTAVGPINKTALAAFLYHALNISSSHTAAAAVGGQIYEISPSMNAYIIELNSYIIISVLGI